jgi:hypothetical protein
VVELEHREDHGVISRGWQRAEIEHREDHGVVLKGWQRYSTGRITE